MKFLLTFLIFFLSFGLYSQSNTGILGQKQQSKELVLKLKKEHKGLQHYAGIQSQELDYWLSICEASIFKRIYPFHTSPEQSTNKYGDTLIDLTLYYELHYQGIISEALLITKLMSTGLFDYVETPAKTEYLFIPNDSLYGNQYYPKIVNAIDAWDITQGDSNVVIGIVDSGTDLLGEDLKDGIAFNYADPIDGIDNDNDGYVDNFMGWDFGDGDNNPTSYLNHHGCFTTGIAAARTNNGLGIAGLGFNTRYLPVKTHNTDADDMKKSYEAMIYAADHGSSIINNSWGGNDRRRYGQDMINYVTYNKDILVVCAAGNSANDLWIYPSSYENALGCAATDSMDQTWEYASYGTSVDICSPGKLVWSTWTFSQYFAGNGSSFSAPGVSAAAALIKAEHPQMSALQIGEQLRVSADIIDTLSFNQILSGQLGSGRLNMYKALVDTLKPSIRMRNRVRSSKNYMPGDSIYFSGEFVNLLAPSSSALQVYATSTSPYLTIVNPIKNLGSLNTLASIDNYNAPFIFKISPNTPRGTIADIKLTYTDTAYEGFEYFRFFINPNLVDLDTNSINISIAGNGSLGYYDGSWDNGHGMYHKNSANLLSFAGFVMGNSSGKVSSNIYGDSGYDSDLESLKTLKPVIPAQNGDEEYLSIFNDNGANFTSLDIEVEQHTYAYSTNPEDVVFLQYTLHNKGSSTYSTLYAGLYADFDLGDFSSQNKAIVDTSLKLTYTYQNQGGTIAGMMLLDTFPLNIYNLDNAGENNSVNIYDGFPDFEKYTCLTQARDSAGFSDADGSDVSSMISAGPFTLAPGDSIQVTFAILAADNESELKNAAHEALQRFQNWASIKTSSLDKTVKVYPNPFDETVSVELNQAAKTNIPVYIYNVNGKLIYQSRIQAGEKGIQLNLSKLPAGKYFYSIQLPSEKQNGSLIRL